MALIYQTISYHGLLWSQSNLLIIAQVFICQWSNSRRY